MSKSMTPNDCEKQLSAAGCPDFLKGFISEEEYANRRGASVRTCQRDRKMRQSPPYVLIGRQVYYRVDAIRDWLISKEQAPDRKPAAPRVGGKK